MNRQFRRAQEKQDKKQDKEKARRREERKSRLRQLRAARGTERTKRPARTPESKPAGRSRNPGRFAGVLAAVTVFFIALQGVAPVEQDPTTAERLIPAGFYLMLGYFATLWYMRRDAQRGPWLGVIGGVVLAVSVTVIGVVQDRSPDPLTLALIVPALIAGALLGRMVYLATPR
jgi:peptidoglycan/LPS O-acetylase OafA/YrhL